jgi:HK97 family phage prohead protease
MPTVATLERKILSLTDAVTTDAGPGSFMGYASRWDERDSYGDIVVRGAYTDTLPQFIARGFIAWGHDWTTPVATIREAGEDDQGLLLTADFHSDDVSQRARQITMERLARGKFMGLSIGYTTQADEQTEAGRLLKKVELFETSLVTVPALASAGVTSAKSDEPLPDPLDVVESAAAAISCCLVDLKAGQPQLSTTRRERLTALRAALHDLGAELDALLAETAPRDREKFARWLECQRIRARRLGVAV